MPDQTEKMSVHTKKYYRVILERVDRQQETTESFAIKLSMRTRTTLPRVHQVLRNLPCMLKSDLSAAQANKLKAVIEGIGGRVLLETHFVTPGRREVNGQPKVGTPARQETAAGGVRQKCPDCGWEEHEEAAYCSRCLRRFGDEKHLPKGLDGGIPHETPLGEQIFRQPDPGETAPAGLWQQYSVLVIAGGVMIILLVILQILE